MELIKTAATMAAAVSVAILILALAGIAVHTLIIGYVQLLEDVREQRERFRRRR